MLGKAVFFDALGRIAEGEILRMRLHDKNGMPVTTLHSTEGLAEAIDELDAKC